MPKGKKKGGNKIRGAGKRIKSGPRKGKFAKK
jgi:hypothetical protein